VTVRTLRETFLARSAAAVETGPVPTQPKPDRPATEWDHLPPVGDLLDVEPLPLPGDGPLPSEVLAAMRDEERW